MVQAVMRVMGSDGEMGKADEILLLLCGLVPNRRGPIPVRGPGVGAPALHRFLVIFAWKAVTLQKNGTIHDALFPTITSS